MGYKAIATGLMAIAVAGCTPDAPAPPPIAPKADNPVQMNAQPVAAPQPVFVPKVITIPDTKITITVPVEKDVSPVAAQKYKRTLVTSAHAFWGLTAPTPVFAAQVQQESGWNELAKSPVGAQGLAQFMPATADWLDDVYPELGLNQPFNPSWALSALVRFDKHLWDRVEGSDFECDHMAFALSAYNGGEKWVTRDKAAAKAKGLDDTRYWGAVEKYNGGRTAAAWNQNRGYPQRILKDLQPKYTTWGRVIKC